MAILQGPYFQQRPLTITLRHENPVGQEQGPPPSGVLLANWMLVTWAIQWILASRRQQHRVSDLALISSSARHDTVLPDAHQLLASEGVILHRLKHPVGDLELIILEIPALDRFFAHWCIHGGGHSVTGTSCSLLMIGLRLRMQIMKKERRFTFIKKA